MAGGDEFWQKKPSKNKRNQSKKTPEKGNEKKKPHRTRPRLISSAGGILYWVGEIFALQRVTRGSFCTETPDKKISRQDMIIQQVGGGEGGKGRKPINEKHRDSHGWLKQGIGFGWCKKEITLS